MWGCCGCCGCVWQQLWLFVGRHLFLQGSSNLHRPPSTELPSKVRPQRARPSVPSQLLDPAAMNSVRAIQQLNKRELEAGISPEGSWHTDYRDTAFVYIGGLAFELSEGDIITIFSQYGEPVWVKLARDKETGKSRGFAWIKYEDQRSCDLAVDNLGGATIMDRVIRVDHARYKPRDDEDMRDNTMGDVDMDAGNDSDGGRRKRRKSEETESEDDRPLLPEEMELERLTEKLDLDDPMRDSMIKQQQEKVDEAVARLKRKAQKEKDRKKRHERRHHRDGSRDRHRDRDRKRIKDVEDHDRRSRRRDDRSRSRDKASDDERRHRKPRHRDDSEDRDRRPRRDRSRDRRERSSEGRDKDRDHRRRRDRSASESDRKPRSKRSPSPRRERSPR
jgi:RNA-binding motif X-linked protein 2